jgi:hypothetical protein
LEEVLVFPSPVLSRHTGDDPSIDGIAWSPDGRYLALHVSGGVMTDYQTLLALSELGAPDTTVDLPIPSGALTAPAVTITHLKDLATPTRQRLLIWAPTSDALLVSLNEATLARLDVATGKLTTVLQLPDLPADARGEITIFAPFPSQKSAQEAPRLQAGEEGAAAERQGDRSSEYSRVLQSTPFASLKNI